jgi:hypothetical protein
VVDAFDVVDEDREALGAGQLDSEDLGPGHGTLDLGSDLPGQLSFLVVCACHLRSLSQKMGPQAHFANCSKCGVSG